MKHLRNVVRGSRSVARAPHITSVYHLRQCVPLSFSVSGTQLFLNYHALSYLCTRCTRCTSFFKLYLQFFKIAILFFKTNFNSNLGGTHGTHCSNPHDCSLFCFSKLVHILVHSWYTQVSSWYTRPRTTNRDPYLRRINHDS